MKIQKGMKTLGFIVILLTAFSNICLAQQEQKTNYNYNISDALGGRASLSDDPAVKRAMEAEALRESQNTISSNSLVKPTVTFYDEDTQVNSTQDDSLVFILAVLAGFIVLYLIINKLNKPKNKLL